MNSEQILAKINQERKAYENLYDRFCQMIPGDSDYEHCQLLISMRLTSIDLLVRQYELSLKYNQPRQIDQDFDCLFASFQTMRNLVQRGKIEEALTIACCMSTQKHNHPWFNNEI